MAVNSVQSSNNAQQAKIAQQVAETRKAQQSSQQARRTQQQSEAQTEAPKPVKNAQGQTTGKVVNTSA